MHTILQRYDFDLPIRVLARLLLGRRKLAGRKQEKRHVMNLYGAERNLPMNLIIDSQLRTDF